MNSQAGHAGHRKYTGYQTTCNKLTLRRDDSYAMTHIDESNNVDIDVNEK